MTKQTSASERIEAARKALDEYSTQLATTANQRKLADILTALIAPPGVGEDVPTITHNIVKTYGGRVDPDLLLQIAVRAGIQSAHETWEPADVPSQEFMLRHLGLDYSDANEDEGGPDFIRVRSQFIAKEEA